MAIRGTPPPGEKPFVPPLTPKEVKKAGEEAKEAPKKAPPGKAIGRGPELDAHGIAVKIAALATEAKKKEVAIKVFGDILKEVMEQTRIDNPQAAMEEINRRIQKEIEETIKAIKANKELMEEAESWQNFAQFLERLGPDQAEHFLELLKGAVRDLTGG